MLQTSPSRAALVLARAKPSKHVEGEEYKTLPTGLSTPVLAFAKPPSMSRGRAHDVEGKGSVSRHSR
jgi:hypothetical protein